MRLSTARTGQVTRRSETYQLASNTILLIGEFQGDKIDLV
jgi:hypothetical protein